MQGQPSMRRPMTSLQSDTSVLGPITTGVMESNTESNPFIAIKMYVRHGFPAHLIIKRGAGFPLFDCLLWVLWNGLFWRPACARASTSVSVYVGALARVCVFVCVCGGGGLRVCMWGATWVFAQLAKLVRHVLMRTVPQLGLSLLMNLSKKHIEEPF